MKHGEWTQGLIKGCSLITVVTKFGGKKACQDVNMSAIQIRLLFGYPLFGFNLYYMLLF